MTREPAVLMDNARRAIITWSQRQREAQSMGDSCCVEESTDMLTKYLAILANLKSQHGSVGELTYIDEHFGV